MQRCTVLLIRSEACGWTDLQVALDAHPAVAAVGVAKSADEAVDLAASEQPDVIISAGRLAGDSVLPLLITLRTKVALESRIIVIASRFVPAELRRFADLGIAGHLLWSDLSTETLAQLLTTVVEMKIFVASRELVDAFVRLLGDPQDKDMGPVVLTAREQDVLQHLAAGLTHRQIAAAEQISKRTVERAVDSLKSKLGAANGFMLACKAGQLGLVANDAD